jgi:hypothetical protein
MYLMTIRRWDMLGALNVRNLLSTRALRAPAGWTLAGQWPSHPAYHFGVGSRNQPLWLYQRVDPVERAFLAERIVTVASAEQAWRAIEKRNLSRVAVLEANTGAPPVNEVSPDDVLDVVEAQPGRLALHSRTSKGRVAVVSEVWHPGWRAFVDGAPVPLHRADGALLGLGIPPGDHHISIRFTPPYWNLGLGLGAAGLMLSIALTLRRPEPRA